MKTSVNLKCLTRNEKIMYIIGNVFQAVSPETSVTLKMVIDKGIEMGIANPYPTDHTGHPWWPHTSLMSGIGSQTAVEEYEEPYLHRKKVKFENGTSMRYWVNRRKVHDVVKNGEKAIPAELFASGMENQWKKDKTNTDNPKLQPVEREDVFEYNGKKISKSWVVSNPDKAQKLYGVAILEMV